MYSSNCRILTMSQPSVSAITYGTPTSPPPFQRAVTSTLSFEATITRLKHALETHEVWLIHEIDPQMLLQRGGYAIRPTRQLLFFHPRYMAQLLAVDPNAVVEAPLKLIVMQMPDERVTVRYVAVETTFGRYVGLSALAEELATLCEHLVQTVTEPSAVVERA